MGKQTITSNEIKYSDFGIYLPQTHIKSVVQFADRLERLQFHRNGANQNIGTQETTETTKPHQTVTQAAQPPVGSEFVQFVFVVICCE